MKLQSILSDLVAVSLKTKQVHWTIGSVGFLSVHKYLDEVYEYLIYAIDELAERMMTIGIVPNGQANAAVASSLISPIGVARIGVEKGIKALVSDYKAVSASLAVTARKHEDDLATQDLLIELLREIDKTIWLLESEVDPNVG